MKLGWVIISMALIGCGAQQILGGDHIKSLMIKESAHVIQDDRLVSAHIAQGTYETFYYLLQHGPAEVLTITVTPCGSTVSWEVKYQKDGGMLNFNAESEVSNNGVTESLSYEKKDAQKGLYMLRIKGETDGVVEFFLTILGPNHVMRPTANLTVTSRRPKGELSIRWPPSLVDPQAMHYWLVVSSESPIKTLCLAKALQDVNFVSEADPYNMRNTDTFVENMRKKTRGIVRGLQPGEKYNIEVFAENQNTHLSYLYGTAVAEYHRTRHIPLKEARPVTANLKRLDGRVSFRYKAKRSGRIEWSVTACGAGAAVDAEVRHKRRPVVPRKRVYGYSTLTLDDAVIGATYILRVNATDPEMLSRITSIEVVGTGKGLYEPLLPSDTKIHEFKYIRTTNSVTLGWNPSTLRSGASDMLQYCLTTKEVEKNSNFSPAPDQCGQNNSLSSFDYYLHQCFYSSSNKKMVTQELKHLQPDRFYDVQLTVRRGKSKILSYEMIRVRTKPFL